MIDNDDTHDHMRLCEQHNKQACDLAKKIAETFMGNEMGVICMAVALNAEHLKREYPGLWIISEKLAKKVPAIPMNDPSRQEQVLYEYTDKKGETHTATGGGQNGRNSRHDA